MKKFLLMMAGSVLLLAACGDGEDSTDPEGEAGGTYEDGEAASLYESNCLSCHGADMEGQSAPGITGLTADEVLAAIEEAPGSMPANLLSGEEAEQVAEYVADQG